MQNQVSGVGLSIERLGRNFSNISILKDFNLEIESGEFVSLLGPSGCGKSTLLRLIAGLDQGSSGKIELSEKGASRSFVFQEANLLPWRSLRENLELVFELSEGGLNRVSSEKIKATLELVGLAPDAEKFPNQLSGGMRMRASVARALLNQPKLLLLDEPFSALDENTRFRLQEELHAIWQKQKMTVVFVTHSISEAVFLSTRAVVIGGVPATVLLNQNIELSGLRNSNLRTDSQYVSLVKSISKCFPKS